MARPRADEMSVQMTRLRPAELLAGLQTPEARAAMDRALRATPAEMGRAGADAARAAGGADE